MFDEFTLSIQFGIVVDEDINDSELWLYLNLNEVVVDMVTSYSRGFFLFRKSQICVSK